MIAVNCVQSCFANLYQNPMKDRTKNLANSFMQNSSLIPTCFKHAAFGGPFSHLLALWKILPKMNWLKLSA